MRILKHENGFIIIDSIGAMTIGTDYEGKARVIVKLIGRCCRGEIPTAYGFIWTFGEVN